MTKKLGLALAVLLPLVFSGCSEKGSYRSVNDIKKSGVLNVCVYISEEPFTYREDNDLLGSEVDFVNRLAETLSVIPVFTEVEKSDIFTMIQSGEADIGIGMLIDSYAGRSTVSYTNYIGSQRLCAVSKTGQSADTLGALSGQKVAVIEGSVYEYGLIASSPTEVEVVSFQNQTAAVESVLKGETYAYLCGELEARDIVTAIQGRLMAQCITNAQRIEFSAALAKGNDSLITEANAVIGRGSDE